MKRSLIIMAACLALWPGMTVAQSYGGATLDAEAAAARMNRDNYPYSVLSKKPILPPQEKRKAIRNQIKYEKYLKEREAFIETQFRTMSADERRIVIETQGYPKAVMPGIK